MSHSVEAILNGNAEKPIKTELQDPSFPVAHPVIRPTPVHHSYLTQGVQQFSFQTSTFYQEQLEQAAMIYPIANQLSGGPPPLPVFYTHQDSTLRSALKMQSKIGRMATVDGLPITGSGFHNPVTDWTTMYPSLAFPPLPPRVQNVGAIWNAHPGMIRPMQPVVRGYISPPVTPTPPNNANHILYQKASAHVRNTPLCRDPRLKLYSFYQQKLFFDPNASDRAPQFVRRDHPTGRWLFDNHVRKEAGRKKPKRKDFDDKWQELEEEEKQEWIELASEASLERNRQINMNFIIQKGLENRKGKRGRARRV